jgi:electron transfer flavoprotein alpha subunit
MTENRDVWVFIEQEDNRIADVSLELLGKAQELSCLLLDSDHTKSQVWAILCGHQVAELPRQLIDYGADHVLVAEHPELEIYRTLPYSRVVVEQVRRWQPYIFLFGATPLGRDLAPRVASAVQAGLTADCTDLQIGDSRKDQVVYKDLLLQIRPAFGGNLIATIVNPLTRPQMATVREGVMHKLEPDPQRVRTVEIINPQFQPGDFALQVLGRQMRESTVKLKDAPVIVAGGGGVSNQAEFDLIRELANLLGVKWVLARRRGRWVYFS